MRKILNSIFETSIPVSGKSTIVVDKSGKIRSKSSTIYYMNAWPICSMGIVFVAYGVKKVLNKYLEYKVISKALEDDED